jgi:two-component system response regulator FixJ
VDDDQHVLESLRWLVESGGLRVETYSDAQAFLERFDPSRAGCVVADVRMPGMSGLELQEALASRGATIPFIIITGHAEVSMVAKAMKRGAFDFLEKPLDNRLLLERIQQALARDEDARLVRRTDGTQPPTAPLSPWRRETRDWGTSGTPLAAIATQDVASQSAISACSNRTYEWVSRRGISAWLRRILGAKGNP